MLCAHVDDGIWAGKGPEFTTAQNKLRKLISIKVEKTGEFEVLGRRISQSAEGIRVDQWDYLKKLTPIPIARARRQNGAALLTPSERTQYLSLTAQLSWPARTTLPGLSFLVSDLQQRTAEAQVKDLVRANWILRKAQEMGRHGECLIFRSNNIPDDDVAVVGIHDASFAQQPGHSSQQGYLVLMSVGGVFTTPEKQPAMLIDWSSTKIHRVVRSTLAAEAASASHAHDRATFVRVLIAEVLFGEHGNAGVKCRSLLDMGWLQTAEVSTTIAARQVQVCLRIVLDWTLQTSGHRSIAEMC